MVVVARSARLAVHVRYVMGRLLPFKGGQTRIVFSWLLATEFTRFSVTVSLCLTTLTGLETIREAD